MKKNDLPSLVKAMSRGDKDVTLLVSSILRGYLHEPDIRQAFEAMWANPDDEIKMYAIWRLLDYTDLTEDDHLGMYNWIKTHRTVFEEVNVQWVGGSDKILAFCEGRLSDSSHPDEKSWIYFLLVSLAPNSDEALAFINKFKDQAPGLSTVSPKVISDLLEGGFDWK